MFTKNRIPTQSPGTCLVCASLLLLIAIGCGSNDHAMTAGSEQGNERSTRDRVTVGQPIKKTLQLFSQQPGRVLAFEETPIVSKVSGYVETVYFDIGDKVTKGQTLIRIHAPEYADQLEQKRGLLGQAESQVKQVEAAVVAAEAAVRSARALVVQAEAGSARAEADHARWESEHNRIQELVKKGSVTPKLADETASQLQAASATKQESAAMIASAEARYHEAEAKLGTATADVEAAKAKLRVAAAEIQQAETMLAYTELVCPFDGYVTSRSVDAGHYVQPAGTSNAVPLMTIANMSKVRVFVNIPESEAGWVDAGFGEPDKGDIVTIASASIAGTPISARVTRTSLHLDSQSRSLATEIDIENDTLKLLPGSFVTVRILLEERADVLTLPLSAIVRDGEATLCCIVREGKVEQLPIELGLRVGDDVQIVSGLEGSESVVLMRASSLQPGQGVDVIQKK
jgi:RND family efflux transporter MFP subunit